jgi:hypothetical protein
MLAVRQVDEAPTRPGLAGIGVEGDGPRADPLVSEARLAKPRLPAPSSVPALVVPREDLRWLDLADDERLLAEDLDGKSTLEATLARQPDRGRAMRILLGLAAQGVVDFLPAAR